MLDSDATIWTMSGPHDVAFEASKHGPIVFGLCLLGGVAAVVLVWVVLPINDCFGYGWDTSWFGSTYIVQSICKGPDPVHGEVGVQELTPWSVWSAPSSASPEAPRSTRTTTANVAPPRNPNSSRARSRGEWLDIGGRDRMRPLVGADAVAWPFHSALCRN